MTTSTNISDQNLRVEFNVHVFSKFVDAFEMNGGFDLPLALSAGPLGTDYYRTTCGEVFNSLIIEPVCAQLRDFVERANQATDASKTPHSAEQPAEAPKPLHEKVHQDDLRLEAAIRIHGQNHDVVLRRGDFTMPCGFMPGYCLNYASSFKEHFLDLFTMPAQIALMEFFNQRRSDFENEQRKEKGEEAGMKFVDRQPWNFGSENLVEVIEKPAEPKVA